MLEGQRLPIKISLAGDGVEALDRLWRRGQGTTQRPERPILVLLDLKMPRMDAFGVLQHIKGDPQL